MYYCVFFAKKHAKIAIKHIASNYFKDKFQIECI